MQTRREMQLQCVAATSPLNLTNVNIVWTWVSGLKYISLLGTIQLNDAIANRVIIHLLVLVLRSVMDLLVSLLNLRNQRPPTSRRPPHGCHYG